MTAPPYNLARFDFVSIRLAVSCARTGSLTGAARECHLVLPAASRRLRDLERALCGPLFERHSRGLVPTALGHAFAKRGMLEELPMDDGSTLTFPGIVPKLSVTPGRHRRNAPTLGQDSDAVLHEMGLSDLQIAELRQRGIVS